VFTIERPASLIQLSGDGTGNEGASGLDALALPSLRALQSDGVRCHCVYASARECQRLGGTIARVTFRNEPSSVLVDISKGPNFFSRNSNQRTPRELINPCNEAGARSLYWDAHSRPAYRDLPAKHRRSYRG
jgi:hypothetical protein